MKTYEHAHKKTSNIFKKSPSSPNKRQFEKDYQVGFKVNKDERESFFYFILFLFWLNFVISCLIYALCCLQSIYSSFSAQYACCFNSQPSKIPPPPSSCLPHYLSLCHFFFSLFNFSITSTFRIFFHSNFSLHYFKISLIRHNIKCKEMPFKNITAILQTERAE